MKKSNWLLLLAMFFWLGQVAARAQVVRSSDPELNRIDVVEHLGVHVPLDVKLTDSQGTPRTLGEFFDGKRPVVLVLAYYHCPMLCNLVLSGVTKALYNVRLNLGEDYQVLTISIDPRDRPQDALQKKESMLKQLGKSADDPGWEFLVGSESEVKRLADVLGFEYFYVPEKNQYAHPAVVFVLDGKGKVTRYLYGIEYKPNDVKLSLLEAAEGKIGTTTDRILLFCFHYDPDARGYVLFASNLMKAGGVLTLVFLGLFIGVLRRKKKQVQGSHQ